MAGLVLAAGAGRRLGSPKALVRDPAGIPWVVRAARLLTAAGCSPVVVVVGAAADEVRAELDTEPVETVEATNWPEGMSASLRTGLTTLSKPDAPSDLGAVVVVPVDVPGLTEGAVVRVMREAGAEALVRATYEGKPGHPVLIGRAHWAGVIASAHGDEGARTYLREHRAGKVECGDIANGTDADTVEDLPPGHTPPQDPLSGT
ncbi:NTP transferase domain-containing protein [Kribbella sp. NPDC048928]|uniref:nucleotidyltransferase family protein n=1 Tax=Kribbella sp. NPDC048928 TaxID=3364111 RepID=UPI00371EB247